MEERPPDSNSHFCPYELSLIFMDRLWHAGFLSAASSLKMVFKFHSQVDVSCLLDSY